MRVLFDTHVLLWTLQDPQQIAGEAARVLKLDDLTIVVSVLSFWEVSIKRSLGKLSVGEDFPARVRGLGHQMLPVSEDHAWRAGALPAHHRDPFDRLLVAQAQVENLPIVSRDRQIERYEVEVIRA